MPRHKLRGGRLLVVASAVFMLGAGDPRGRGNPPPKFSPIDVCAPRGNAGWHRVTVHSAPQLRAFRNRGATVLGRGFDRNCEGGLQLKFEPALPVAEPSMPGLDGGPPRVVGAAVGRDGSQDEFVENEIQIRVTSPEQLESFIALYDAELLRDDTVIGMADDGTMFEVPGGGDGWHLVRIDPATVPLDQAIDAFWNAGFRGQVSFSSEAMASTLAGALRGREQGFEVGPNQVFEKTNLFEHPTTAGGSFIDFAEDYTMTEDDDASEPGEQGLSIGTARAFEYLRHTGLPPIRFGGSWEPARVAVIDTGFALDPVTGLGNPDYVGPLGTPGVAPLQVDISNGDITAGQATDTSDKPWHGQGAFGVCCASPRNRFGSAGSGGEYVRPILIRIGLNAWELASALRSAAFMQAAIVTISLYTQCGDWCEAVVPDSELQPAVFNVTSFGGVVFAAAGNDSIDLTGKEYKPCTLEQVICVGGMDEEGDNLWNYGAPVDLWGPTPRWSTVAPVFAIEDPDDFGFDELYYFGGTSSATPFVAGIAALAKAADPSLRWDALQDLLLSTGNTSSDPLVNVKYPDALRLVQAIRPNPAPEVLFVAPTDGERDSWFRFGGFLVALDDPPAPEGFQGQLVIESNLDGVICDQRAESRNQSCGFGPSPPPSLGTHLITATATDEFGASSSQTISLTLSNGPPSVAITSPSDGDSFLLGQTVTFTATAFDADGESPEVTWTSSLDGPLGTGASTSRTLSAGTHLIEVEATDAYDVTAVASVQIQVSAGSGTPVAQITSPPADFAYTGGRSPTVVLRGNAFDAEDGGELPGGSLSWFSDKMGFLGTGAELPVTLIPDDCGSGHRITLQATDSDGNTSSDTININHAVC